MLAVSCVGSAAQSSGSALNIYYIDTEGGQSTLFVGPTGESLLVDTGNAGERDLSRIAETLRTAGVSRIDHMWTTHFHGDHVGALKIYQALAADGLATAKFNLGVMYDFGQGVAKDPAQAVRWYRAAAAQGHGGAQFNLGGMYFDGVGVAQDHVRSYAWFTLAAAAGAPGASRNRSALAKLLDVAQMEQAQRLVRDCQARNFAGCE